MLPGSPWCPAVEMMLRMRPSTPCSIIDRATYFVSRNAPVRITSVCLRHSASDMSSMPFLLKKAALLTRMSIFPNAARAASTVRLTWSSSQTSHVSPSALPPAASIARAQSAAFSGRESMAIIVAPSLAKPSAIPPPIFGLDPVTSATLPLRRMFVGLWLGSWRRDQEGFGRVEDPGVDELGGRRLAIGRVQRPGQAHPVQQLLVSAVLDGGGRVVSPGLIVAAPQRLVHASVRGRVGEKEMVLASEEGV